ncbi:MAG: hypothetical protein ACUVWR_01535 [Anaerolineae bacterium]
MVLDYGTLSAAVVVVFVVIGFLQGGARMIMAVAVALAVIVGLGEPTIATAALSVGQRVGSVVRRAVGAGPMSTPTDTGPYYFAIYMVLLVSIMCLSRMAVRESLPSKSSRLFGGILGLLNGLLFSLMVREHLLPSLGHGIEGEWVIQIRLQPEVAAASLPSGGHLSVGTVAYIFGLLLAGAGVLRKVRSMRGPSL